MRTVDLTKIAAQAELLRVRRYSRRTAVRAAFGAVAGVFVIAALAAAHVVIVLALPFQPIEAILIVGGGDLVIALVLGLLAMRDQPDQVEIQAQEVKQAALTELRELMALTAVVAPVLRLVGGRKAYGLALAALTAHYLGGRR